MKKILTSLVLLFSFTLAFAQEKDSVVVFTPHEVRVIAEIFIERDLYRRFSEISDSIIVSQEKILGLKDSIISSQGVTLEASERLWKEKDQEAKTLEKRLKKTRILGGIIIGFLGISTILGLIF